MRYKIINRSHQEGVLMLEGEWRSIPPGATILSDSEPQLCSQNVVVRNIASPVEKKNIVNSPVRSKDSVAVKLEKHPEPKKEGE